MKKAALGFTLLELLMVITIVGLLLGIGVPAMGSWIRNSRMTSAANEFLGAMHLARTEAIKRRARVSVCTSANALAAAPNCDASADLAGWFVWVDDNGDAIADATDGNGIRDGGEPVLIQREGLPAGITATSTLPELIVTYRDNGFATDSSGMSMVFCDSRGTEPRGIFLTASGRPEVTRDKNIIAALGGCP